MRDFFGRFQILETKCFADVSMNMARIISEKATVWSLVLIFFPARPLILVECFNSLEKCSNLKLKRDNSKKKIGFWKKLRSAP